MSWGGGQLRTRASGSSDSKLRAPNYATAIILRSMSKKQPFPCLSSPQTSLPSGTTCTLERIRLSRVVTIPPDFPYSLEYDAGGPHIPYLCYSGQGRPSSTMGNVGDIYHDFLADIVSSPVAYARTDSGWTPWAGPKLDGLVHHLYVPEFVLWTTRTNTLHCPYEWRLLEKIDPAGMSQCALAEKVATKEGAEMSKLRAAADRHGLRLVLKSDIEVISDYGTDEELLPLAPWSGAPLTGKLVYLPILLLSQSNKLT